MKNLFSSIGIVFGTIAVFVGLTFGGYYIYRYFAPKYANVQQKIFENNASYDWGMVRDLENLKMKYDQISDPAQKQALRSVILHRFSVYPKDRLPVDLSLFYNQLQTNP